MLAVIAVVAAVVPFVYQARATAVGLQRDILTAALSQRGEAFDPDDLKSLVSTTGLSGAALLDNGDVHQHGDPTGLEELAERCPPRVAQGAPTLLESVNYGDYELLGACIALPDGRRLLGTRSIVAFSKQGTNRSVLFLALVFGSLAGAVVATTVRRMLSPLSEMSEAARALGAGQTPPLTPPAEPELRPLAEALNQLGAQLQAREDEIEGRLAVQRQVAAVVAHEVRNPLQSITLLTDLVAHEKDPVLRKDLLVRIQQELALIEVVVQRLVSGGGELRLVRRNTELAEVVERCMKMQGPRAREQRVELRARVLAQPSMRVDAALLRRALENLVSNAIAIRGDQGGGVVEITLDARRSEVVLYVDDDGDGVPEEEREGIFLSGVSRRTGGTGLGLPLARKVTEAHGGSLDVGVSQLGGARFTLALPMEES